jgi:thiamine-phosphate pyrophosphorylase
MTLDPFYPIVESADWVRRLLSAGAKVIQIRAKDQPPDILRREIRNSLALCRAAGAQLIVNDYWDVAIDEGADYIHLGQSDLDGADIKRIRAHGLKLGVSTHDHAELDRALSLDPDYVALGPIYPTRLKAMPFGPQGLERIGEWKKLIGSRPLVAIGGISLERAPLCLAAGANIVSVVTDITLDRDPEARTRAWVAATRPAA